MNETRAGLRMGDVAKRTALAPSAIRYYERLGLLPRPATVGGKRLYHESVLRWLGLIGLARRAGFTMAELERLVLGFPSDVAPAARWKELATRKLAELDAEAARIARRRELLGVTLECECERLEDCGQLFPTTIR